jgi:hypothetical protein
MKNEEFQMKNDAASAAIAILDASFEILDFFLYNSRVPTPQTHGAAAASAADSRTNNGKRRPAAAPWCFVVFWLSESGDE